MKSNHSTAKIYFVCLPFQRHPRKRGGHGPNSMESSKGILQSTHPAIEQVCPFEALVCEGVEGKGLAWLPWEFMGYFTVLGMCFVSLFLSVFGYVHYFFVWGSAKKTKSSFSLPYQGEFMGYLCFRPSRSLRCPAQHRRRECLLVQDRGGLVEFDGGVRRCVSSAFVGSTFFWSVSCLSLRVNYA